VCYRHVLGPGGHTSDFISLAKYDNSKSKGNGNQKNYYCLSLLLLLPLLLSLSLLQKRVIIFLMPMNMSAPPPDINQQLTNEQQKRNWSTDSPKYQSCTMFGRSYRGPDSTCHGGRTKFYPDEFLGGEEREQLADYGRDIKHLPPHNAVGPRPSRNECASIVRTKYYDAQKKVDNELKIVKKEIATMVDNDIKQWNTVLVDDEEYSPDPAGDAKNANASARPRPAVLSSHNIMPTRQQLLTAAYENDITLQQLLEEKEELVSNMDHETDVQFSNELYEYNK
jgi:hypothetical protein